jgi:hypothetical protein
MYSSSSLKGYLPATAFVMAKKAKAAVRVEEMQTTRQELPTDVQNSSPQYSKILNPGSTATTHTAPLSLQFLFLESLPTLGGASSELLQKMIDAMSVKREEARIENLKDLSSKNPNANGLVLGAKVVIALGEEAAQALLKSKNSLAELRGKVHFLRTGERVIVTFHPSYLLQNAQSKKDAWEDLKLALREMSAP